MAPGCIDEGGDAAVHLVTTRHWPPGKQVPRCPHRRGSRLEDVTPGRVDLPGLVPAFSIRLDPGKVRGDEVELRTTEVR